jgi:hypothetical protein
MDNNSVWQFLGVIANIAVVGTILGWVFMSWLVTLLRCVNGFYDGYKGVKRDDRLPTVSKRKLQIVREISS